MCLAVGFRGRKSSEKGSWKELSEKGLREGTWKAETRLFKSTTRFRVWPKHRE